ncbi:cytochrome P450, partial [Xylogone sp. PMI_703]
KWLVGNALELSSRHFWLKFKEWGDKWGPIYKLSIFGKTHLVVSTEQVANALLTDKGAIYSCREQLPFAAQLLTRGNLILLHPYGDGWRNMRRFMHQAVNTKEAISYEPVQLYEVKRLVFDLIRAPEKYEMWFERFSGSEYISPDRLRENITNRGGTLSQRLYRSRSHIIYEVT